MDFWTEFSTFVVEQQRWVGSPVLVAALLTIFLPPIIAQTAHAKRQVEPVPSFPVWPGQHFRFAGYVFGRDAWRSNSNYGRTLVVLYRLASAFAATTVVLLFAANVTVMNATR